MLHGGGGNKDQPTYSTVSEALAEAGLLVFNANHALGGQTPQTMVSSGGRALYEGLENIGCALRYAAEHAAEYGGDETNITVLGHSAGGLSGALAVLGGTDLDDAVRRGSNGVPSQVDCVSTWERPAVTRFVSDNGALFILAHPDSPFRPTDAQLRAFADPRAYVAGLTGSLRVRLILGANDSLTPQWHQDDIRLFAEELGALGHDAGGRRDPGLTSPDAPVFRMGRGAGGDPGRGRRSVEQADQSAGHTGGQEPGPDRARRQPQNIRAASGAHRGKPAKHDAQAAEVREAAHRVGHV